METTPTNNEWNHPYPESPEPPRRGRRILGMLVIGGLAAGAAGFLFGSTMPVADAALHAFSRSRGCHGEHARERAGMFVSFALHRLDATDEQEERVQEIVGNAIDELEPLREQHHAARSQLASLLAQPTIDRGALEDLRQRQLALADGATRTIATAVADTAEVLTPAQRIELVEHLERFGPHGHDDDED